MAAAAESKRPTARTASTCTPQTARGTHAFKIAGYSLHQDLVAGKCIRSAAFAVGGYTWCICYYPNGDKSGKFTDRVQAYLELMTRGAEVRALFRFRLVDHATGQSDPMHPIATPMVTFRNMDCFRLNHGLGSYSLMTKKEVEASSYLCDDTLIIECDVTVVVKEPRVELEESSSRVQVPPSDPSNNLRKMLQEKTGSDVTFLVKGAVISAHKIILATRSPVFSAEFYGPKAANTEPYITVDDIDPDVFRALLHFIYTDSVTAAVEDLDARKKTETVMHLLVAADRYGVERLKLICEDILCKRIDTGNVVTVLALAEHHDCSSLRDACVEFVASTNKLDVVVASQGYKQLRKGSPNMVVDMLEKVTKWMHRHKKM